MWSGGRSPQSAAPRFWGGHPAPRGASSISISGNLIFREVSSMRFFRIIGLLSACLLAAFLLNAQTETGQITGTVFDQSGGAIPNAKVTATDLGTKATRTATTGNSGNYTFPNLQAGRYEVS